jgi:hypothetical protein
MQLCTSRGLGRNLGWLLAVVATVSAARAQSFNIDIGTANPAPSAGYGAASGQAGVWQSIPGNAPGTSYGLVDVAGSATAARASYVLVAGGPLSNGYFNNPDTLLDDELLLDDHQSLGQQQSLVEWTFLGLQTGNYRVYAYAWSPFSQNQLTWVGITEAVPSGKTCGGDWFGVYVLGEQYALLDTYVAGPLKIRFVSIAGPGSINGIQLVSTGCSSHVAPYCTAKVSSSGCIPSIRAEGFASLSIPASLVVRSTQLEINVSALTFFGTSGLQSTPFQGGFLCVKPPLHRLPIQNSSGGAACFGSIAYTLQDYLDHPGGGSLVVPGASIDSQTWFRDPQAATTTGLSGSVRFDVCP